MGILKATKIKTVGLCHSVPVCVCPICFKQLWDFRTISGGGISVEDRGDQPYGLSLGINQRDREGFFIKIRELTAAKPHPHQDSVAFRIDETF